jgi:hypothetical protein
MYSNCKSAGKFDDERGRWNCTFTGDDCFYYIPDSKSCAKDFGEGPDAEIEGGE